MSRLACALSGISVAAFAAGSALAGSVSGRLSVTVTVVAPGTLGGTNLPPGASGASEETTGQPAAAGPPQDRPAASTPLPETAPATR
jgi:hypothetical protein